jgi:CHASE2 domain-containing sensor protein
MHDDGSLEGSSHGSGPAGVNIHDPILEEVPHLRRLKRQVPWAIATFVLGLLVGLSLLIGGLAGLPKAGAFAAAALIGAGITVLLGGVGYFAYVTVALSTGARRAQERRAFAQLNEALRQSRRR